jgi:hypothetical protein
VYFLALGLCDPWRSPEQGQPESSHPSHYACTLHLIVTVESSGTQLYAEWVQFGLRSILFDMEKASSSKAGSAALTHKERVDRALRGQDLDRPLFTFHHYKRPNAQLEASDHLEFHRTYNTDIVKVMNDFDFPQSTTGKWYELEPLDSPFPNQLATLRLVRDGLNGDAYFHRHDLWSLYDGDDLISIATAV